MLPSRILAVTTTAVFAGSALTGCAVGRRLGDMLRERPPAPLDSMSRASDARIDSLGILAGSFVGEGTSRAVHLLSSDTAFISELARRYRPDLLGGEGLWRELSRRRVVGLGDESRRRTVGRRGPEIRRALVGSPLGHTEVTVDGIFLHGGRGAAQCGSLGAQAELVVREARDADDPPLRGPVLGVVLADESETRARGLVRRPEVPKPSEALIGDLVQRTGREMDSTLAALYPSLQLRPVRSSGVEINTLADLDAADVIAFRAGPATIRYAVSLRGRRVGAGGRDTLVATAVMVWDSAGAWRQTVFQPTLLAAFGGQLDAYGMAGRPYYWRRLQPISDVAFA
ncbi:MAG: hypothetical protein H0T68_05875, partial [Gemmatimonadales bacterium]|nr:hypothetical protein [Gemmatimonadales bacterium]